MTGEIGGDVVAQCAGAFAKLVIGVEDTVISDLNGDIVGDIAAQGNTQHRGVLDDAVVVSEVAAGEQSKFVARRCRTYARSRDDRRCRFGNDHFLLYLYLCLLLILLVVVDQRFDQWSGKQNRCRSCQ